MTFARQLTTAAAVLALTVGCAGPADPAAAPTSTSIQWGERALMWWGALGQAAAEGPQHVKPFLADDLVWENRLDGNYIQGADNWVDQQVNLWGVFLPRDEPGLFVSADEALNQSIIPMGPPLSFLDRMVIDPDGVRHWVRAGSLAGISTLNSGAWNWPDSSGRHYDPWRNDDEVYDGLIDRYVALWNGAEDVQTASVYTERAVVSDTLLGDSVSGLAALDRVVESRSRLSIGFISVVALPDGGGRAAYLAPSNDDWMGPEELRLVIEADDGSGCPGRMAVALGLAGERVSWERRYHDITSVRRCHDPNTVQPGWWEDMQIPSTIHVERTGTVSYEDIEVEVFNGTPAVAGFLAWGFSRFDAAGLPLPQVSSVTFLQARATCYNLGGRVSTTDEGASVTLCRAPADICTDEDCQDWVPRARQLWLHELAHPWLAAHTDEATRSAFLELAGLSRWDDHDDPWSERGVEVAAAALAFGLMDEPVLLHPEFGTDCEVRTAQFRILTGTSPIDECASEPDTTSGS